MIEWWEALETWPLKLVAIGLILWGSTVVVLATTNMITKIRKRHFRVKHARGVAQAMERGNRKARRKPLQWYLTGP